LPFTVHRSPFIVHRSPFTVHRSPFTVHRSPFFRQIPANSGSQRLAPSLLKPPGMLAKITAVIIALALPAAAMAQERDNTDEKSPALAATLPLIGIGASVAVMAWGANREEEKRPGGTGLMVAGLAGVAISPALGHFYTRRYRRGLAFAGIATGTVVVGGLALASVFELEGDESDEISIMLLAMGGYAVTTAIGLSDAYKIAKEHNLTIAPTALRTSTGQTKPGIALGFSF
jgi:hypothetical protein